MRHLTHHETFWLAVLVIGGYMLFGVAVAFIPIREGATIFINTVFSTMGPLVGWTLKALIDGSHASGKADDPLHTVEEGTTK